MLVASFSGTGDTAVGYSVPPAIHWRAPVGAKPPLAEIGTGGMASDTFYLNVIGYAPFLIVETTLASANSTAAGLYAELMGQVKEGFGRTMSRLPEVFGVSRQTLYNWLDGDTPKPAHQNRLAELAEAARVFSEAGIRPTSLMLDRSLTNGKSLLQLLKDGADGREAALALVRVLKRGEESRTKLETMLGGRKGSLQASDMGAPSLSEDA